MELLDLSRAASVDSGLPRICIVSPAHHNIAHNDRTITRDNAGEQLGCSMTPTHTTSTVV